MPISKASSNAVAPAAKGDLVVGNATNDSGVLAVGANDTILTADSSTATGLKWAAAATPSSGATLIARTTFSGVSSVDFDNFSGTYENYLVQIQAYANANDVTLRLRARYSGTTFTSSNYNFGFIGVDATSDTTQVLRGGSQAQFNLTRMNNSYYTLANLNFYRVNGSGLLQFTGNLFGQQTYRGMAGGGVVESSQTWTGLRLFPETGTITGQVSVYGLASA